MEIDLNEPVNIAARELFAVTASAHEEDLFERIKEKLKLKEMWDNGEVPLTTQNRYRENVLPFINASHRSIARQAYEKGRLDEIHAHATAEYRPNPYEEI